MDQIFFRRRKRVINFEIFCAEDPETSADLYIMKHSHIAKNIHLTALANADALGKQCVEVETKLIASGAASAAIAATLRGDALAAADTKTESIREVYSLIGIGIVYSEAGIRDYGAVIGNAEFFYPGVLSAQYLATTRDIEDPGSAGAGAESKDAGARAADTGDSAAGIRASTCADASRAGSYNAIGGASPPIAPDCRVAAKPQAEAGA